MDSELFALEEKIEQFISLCQGLRAENQELRTRVAALEADNKRLTERIDAACVRLEGIMRRLPEQ
ncbi:MAG: hypothetical protein AB1768_08860 [Pseudomonadota bacterium]|jgi:cell division protein ZapB